MQSGSFIPGIPKGEYWIRLNTSEIPVGEEIGGLLSKFPLTAKPQDDGYLLIYGAKESVKAFLNEVRLKMIEEGLENE